MKGAECLTNRTRLYSLSHSGTVIYQIINEMPECKKCVCYCHTENSFNGYCVDDGLER